MFKQLLIGLTLLCISWTAHSETPPKQYVWKGDPIAVSLSTHAEQRITFPGAKLVWADIPNFVKDKLKTQIVGNNVYWTAKAAFKRIRITLGEEGSGKVYLLDVVSSNARSNNTRIVIKDGVDPYGTVAAKPAMPRNTPVDWAQKRSRSPIAGYASLLKFAAKEVYAPERLRDKGTGIIKVPTGQQTVQHLLPGNAYHARTAVAWRAGGLYVTAVEISNRSRQPLRLDPREIRGVWKAALFYRNALSAAGSRGDNTTLFLISEQPFKVAVQSHPMIRVGR